MSDQVTLKINNSQTNLNPFVSDLFINVISGLIHSLHGIPEKIEKIEINITKTKENK